MSQALRVSQWLPTADPAVPVGSAVLSNGAPLAAGPIPSRFFVPPGTGGGGGGGGGIEEAPLDGTPYVRVDGAWVSLDGGTF